VRLVEPSATTKLSALGVEEQRVNTIVDLLSPHDQWKALGDGFRVEVRITTFEKDGVVKMPASALFRDGGDWAAYVVDGEHARKRMVRVSRRSGTETMVSSGVRPGDRVIVYPGDAVKDGTRITLR
jgi:HlyD family secretion protein